MGFRSSRRRRSEDNSDSSRQVTQQRGSTGWSNESQQESSGIWTNSVDRGEQHFGMTIPDHRTLQRLRMAEDTYGQQVHEWVDEGMPTEIMGKTRDMEAFRQRQAERPPEVPTDIERQHKRSVQRSEQAAAETGAAGETGVPESVRDVIASTGRSLDASIQRAMEDRMDDSLGDVRIHTGPQAAAACEAINARAFTVGNHVAFNAGEYDPNSAEGQHVLAHELAHVRQQTDGAVSLLPQEEVELEVDPDPALEREAEETAQRVMQGGELGIQRLADTEVHIQRIDKTRRDLLKGEVSLDEAATGLEEVDLDAVDSDRLRDAYTYAEYVATAGTTTGIAQTIASEFNLTQPEAIAVTLAVGGTIQVGKDRLHRKDYYVIYEIGKTLGIEDRVLAFFNRMGIELPASTDTEAGEGGHV